jgi:maleylpyruvate isomerase
MPPDRSTVEPWLRVETTRMLATVETFWDRDLTEVSSLPGWSWGHLLTHLARNADALGNLLSWARTGVETPMYRSKSQRDDDINIGATRPGGVLLSDVADSAARLG